MKKTFCVITVLLSITSTASATADFDPIVECVHDKYFSRLSELNPKVKTNQKEIKELKKKWDEFDKYVNKAKTDLKEFSNPNAKPALLLVFPEWDECLEE